MSTLDAVLQKQATSSILVAPQRSTRPTPLTTQTNSTLNIALQNESSSNNVYAYVTGLAINNSNSVFLLQSDGVTPYYPSSPSSNGTPLAANCAIPLGAPGSTTIVTIPQVNGARVWFSINGTLTFLLNPGPGLVEPSVNNPSDPNINIYWDFCELTFNSFQVFANITYVDFVSLPISLTLTNTAGGTQYVSGLPPNGLDTICAGLQAQDANDNAGWSQLIVTSNGANLRALSPNNGIVMNNSLFSGYYEPYVNAVWSQYSNAILSIDTQASWGIVSGEVSNSSLIFSGIGSWSMPSTADIFNCSSGAFSNTAGEVGNIAARLCAGFNRSTLLIDNSEPDDENPATYYQTSPTNHYSRIVHAANLDGLGYAFPYDDVHPTNGQDLSGAVADSSPQLLTIAVGGNGTQSKLRHKRGLEVTGVPSQSTPILQKQITLDGNSDETPRTYSLAQQRDLEKGVDGPIQIQAGPKPLITLPEPLQHFFQRILEKLPILPPNSPLGSFITFLNTLILSLLSLSVRKMLSRALFCVIMVLLYLLAGRLPGTAGDDVGSPSQIVGGIGVDGVNIGDGQ